MNQIKQKIEEIGLSQREISKRLGKNASYLAGVFRTGLSTAKQAELLKDLEVVGKGGYFQSEGDIIAELDRSIAKLQDANSELRAESDKYFNELSKTKSDFEMMGKFFDQCKHERFAYQDKYERASKVNIILSLSILLMVILWVLA